MGVTVVTAPRDGDAALLNAEGLRHRDTSRPKHGSLALLDADARATQAASPQTCLFPPPPVLAPAPRPPSVVPTRDRFQPTTGPPRSSPRR
jgi:hypothetical protein